MDELQKWMDVANQNFSDNRFSVWLNSTKAFNAFQNSNLPLNQNSYRAQLAIIDGLLVNYLNLSDNKILNSRKIAYLILYLDKLILKAESIDVGNNGLNDFAKCLLYMRTGDYILGINSTSSISSKAQKQILPAIYSYCLAYHWACKGWIDREVEANPLLALCILELHILIKKNLDEAFDRKINVYNCNGYLLHTFLRNFAEISDSAGQFKKNYSFMLMDKTIIAKNLLQNLDIGLTIEKAYQLRGNVNFLRRFVWIISNSPCFEQNNYQFLDNLLHALPQCPVDPHDAGTPESFSIIDIKIFLYRLTRHLKCIWPIDRFLLPWLFYQKPTSSQQQFWKSLNKLIDQPNDCFELQSLMEIEKGLGQIRAPDMASTASESIIDTINFIKQMRNMPAMLDGTQDFCENLIRRYSEAVGTEINPESDWVLVVEESEEAGEQISLQQKSEIDSTCIEEIDSQEEQSKNEEKFQENNNIVKESHSISTQTESEKLEETGDNSKEENALRDWIIARDWGEINFHIGRWAEHNKALQKLFS